jgi:hypothetical protein
VDFLYNFGCTKLEICFQLTISPSSVSQLSRKCENLDISQTSGPSRPVIRIALFKVNYYFMKIVKVIVIFQVNVNMHLYMYAFKCMCDVRCDVLHVM